MRSYLKILLMLLVVTGLAVAAVHSDPVISVMDNGQVWTIHETAPLTEATAKRLSGPVSAIATSQVTAASAGTSGVAARPTRMRLALENISGENVWYSGTSPATGTNSVLIVPGASTSMLYNGALYLYSASGNATVCVSEGYNP